MNKKIILTGDACTGKSFTANMIANAYNNVVYILLRKVNKKNPHFIYNQVSEETDLIIIDDVCPDKFQIFEYLIFAEKLVVEKQCKAPFKIKIPDVIITFDGSHEFFKDFGISFFMRCKIIECSKDGHLFLHKEVKFHNAVNQLIN